MLLSCRWYVQWEYMTTRYHASTHVPRLFSCLLWPAPRHLSGTPLPPRRYPSCKRGAKSGVNAEPAKLWQSKVTSIYEEKGSHLNMVQQAKRGGRSKVRHDSSLRFTRNISSAGRKCGQAVHVIYSFQGRMWYHHMPPPARNQPL